MTISSSELQCHFVSFCVKLFNTVIYAIFDGTGKRSYEMNAQCVLDIQAITVQFKIENCSCHQISASVSYDSLSNFMQSKGILADYSSRCVCISILVHIQGIKIPLVRS